MSNGYRWNNIALVIQPGFPITLTAGARWVVSRPPGGRGISATIPDGEVETVLSCVLGVRSHAAMLILQAAFARHAEGDLEIPVGDDAMVYAGAYVERPPIWEFVAHDRFWRARVEFVCPDPLPCWKSSGEPVY